jgi:hypothetical protein
MQPKDSKGCIVQNHKTLISKVQKPQVGTLQEELYTTGFSS